MADAESPPSVAAASAVLGWTYTICWTASIYPLIISNIRRRSTHGISDDYCLLNLVGMVAYAAYNTVFVYSTTVRRQFAERNPDSPTPLVQANDVAYAVHGMLLSAVVYSQMYPRLWGWETCGTRQARHSKWCVLTCAACCVAASLGALAAVLLSGSGLWMWLDLVYLVGGIKTALTLVKCTPQAWLNYRTRSTKGLPLLPFVLDMAGSVLSVLQLVIDSAYSGNETASASNPIKLILAYVSMAFDLTFLFQHYVLYRASDGGGSSRSRDDSEVQNLLEVELDQMSLGTSSNASK